MIEIAQPHCSATYVSSFFKAAGLNSPLRSVPVQWMSGLRSSLQVLIQPLTSVPVQWKRANSINYYIPPLRGLSLERQSQKPFDDCALQSLTTDCEGSGASSLYFNSSAFKRVWRLLSVAMVPRAATGAPASANAIAVTTSTSPAPADPLNRATGTNNSTSTGIAAPMNLHSSPPIEVACRAFWYSAQNSSDAISHSLATHTASNPRSGRPDFSRSESARITQEKN